jgi:hypothetical protein
MLKRYGIVAMAGVLVTIATAGCVTPDPAAQARQAQQRANYLASLQTRCGAYGFESGTADMAACVQRLDMEERKARERRSRCLLVMGEALGQPTRTGAFGESTANGNAAYNKYMAGQ